LQTTLTFLLGCNKNKQRTIYSDKNSVFRVPKADAQGGQGMTQFGRALAELNIEIICANSSQAKGRVERANRTLQDRLVKELRLEGVSDIGEGNAFLPGFQERFNAQFSVAAVRAENMHRALNVKPDRLRDILCHREQRYVTRQLALSYDHHRIILTRNEVTEAIVGRYVDVYDFADGQLEIRWKGVSLPYKSFDKDQRVSHAAIVENKRLGAALALIKAQQDAGLPPPRVKTNSEAGGYQPNGRKPGRRSFLAPKSEPAPMPTGPSELATTTVLGAVKGNRSAARAGARPLTAPARRASGKTVGTKGVPIIFDRASGGSNKGPEKGRTSRQ